MRNLIVIALVAYSTASAWAQVVSPTGSRSSDGATVRNFGDATTSGRAVVRVRRQTSDATRLDGASELVTRALRANGGLVAARLELNRARARLQQAGVRPNPTLDAHLASGRLAGSEDERDVNVGLSLPFELGGKRQRRLDFAQADLAAAEAEIADRQRRLTQQVLTAYADALAAARELEITTGVQDLDDQTVRVLRTRVEQRAAPPLELNLLLTEAARLRSQRALAEGRLNAALGTLRLLIGAAPSEPLPPADPQSALAAEAVSLPATLEDAIATALEMRPDVTLARLNERAAEAGLRLARAQAMPDLTVSAAVSTTRSFLSPDGAPIPILDVDRAVTVGISIPLPFSNRNQGAIAESAVAIQQARVRREFVEHTVRSEVTSAYQRLRAAQAATEIFERSVTIQATENLRVIRAAYQLGEFRITDVITQQRQFLDVAREYATALAERYRAGADLRAALGSVVGSQP